MSRRIIPQHSMYRVAVLLLVVSVLWFAASGAPSHAQDGNSIVSAGYAAVFGYAQQLLSSSIAQAGGSVITSPPSNPISVPNLPSGSTFTSVTVSGPNFTLTFGSPFGANPFVQPSMFPGWSSGYTIP